MQPAVVDLGLSIAMPHPDVGVPAIANLEPPDPSEHLRWPLTPNSHPALEPTYAIASVLAADGVSWTDLCRLGAQNRRASGGRNDAFEYLRGWCEVARHEPMAAVVKLAPLLRSTTLGIPAAVRIDIANILVDGGDAEQAQNALMIANIDDLPVFDTIAASYAEVGKTADAMVVNNMAISAHDARRPVDHCERLTRRLLLVPEDVRFSFLADFEPYGNTPRCAELARELACWMKVSCSAFLLAHGVDPAAARIADILTQWPTAAADSATWWQLSRLAYTAVPTPGADRLAAAALEATMRSIGCRGSLVQSVQTRAYYVRWAESHDPSLDPLLDRIIDKPTTVCDAP
ncbi:hypothetical protein BH11MYX3_BH11MYX3_30770 [soil metagenome]